MFYAAFKLVKALQCSNDITKLHRQIMISGTAGISTREYFRRIFKLVINYF